MMKKILKSLLLMLMALMWTNTWASGVDLEAARSTAMRFMQTNSAGKPVKGRTADMVLVQAQPSKVGVNLNDYYVFNASDGSSFVIVSGDDRAEPVLAYGDGAFNMADLPCNLQWMLNHYKEQMDWLHEHPGAEVQLAPTSSQVVSPLLPCTWSQGEPYNNMCPYYKGKRCVTGCVATAMAQVMYYWKYPNELPDLFGYSTMGGEIVLPDLPPVTLDWDNMLDSYGYNSYTEEQGNAVATLMRYCGQASYMGYSPTGSGALCQDQVVAMRMFGYDPASILINRDDYSAEEWTDKMVSDLTNHYPILYAGFSPDGGHAFVVCGYNGSKFYINWGWEGSYDGYFALDAFVGGGMWFTTGQQMITELYPFEFGVTIAPYDFEVDGIYYKKCDGGVKVVNRDELYNTYSGNVTIPTQVTNGGETYTVTAIGHSAFRGSTGLTGVTIPSTVTTIGKYAFKDCIRLNGVIIPSSVKMIDYSAFEGCNNLKSLSLSNGLEEIGYYAFIYCPWLTQVTIPRTVKRLGDGAFYSCNRLKKVTIGDGVEKVGSMAFAFCDALTDVVIGDGVKLIDEAAFYYCRHLENVTVGAGVDSIGDLAFYRCNSLKALIMHPELPPLTASEECFSEVAYENATIYVADEWIMEDYYWADVWTLFTHFALMEELPSTPGDVNGDGEVSIADINALLDMILNGDEGTNGDVNSDGEINIADINAVIDLILKS